MWSRKELKKNARLKIKRNYWVTIAVCFLLAFFGAEYAFSTNVIYQYDANESYTGKVVQNKEKNTNAITTKNVANDIHAIEVDEKEEISKVKKVIDSGFNAITGNEITTFRIVDALGDFLEKKPIQGIISIIAVLVSLCYIIFVRNILRVGERKFFLENKKGTKIREILYAYKEKRLKNTAWVMFTRDLYLVLWAFTIIGLFIKYYEYKMIPYILAEDPHLKRKEVYTLTKKLMKGNKWRAFVLDLSFIGWYILMALTLGLVGIFYVNPYLRGTETELYLSLKNKDNTIKEKEIKKQKRELIKINSDVKYTVINLILFFFVFAIVGYFYEVIYHFIRSGNLVNRGTMYGPWLPIYGFGGVASIILLKKLRKNPALTFILVMVISGVMEYFTSYFLEITKGVKYWDYSGFLLNLNGRICLEGLLAFAFAGTLCIYIVGPSLNKVLNKIPLRIKWLIAIMLVCLIFMDGVYSHYKPNTGKGITYSYAENIVLKNYLF